jgi:hypothetical protein
MAKEAEWLLEGTDWLPEPLRTPEFAVDGPSGVETGGEDEALPALRDATLAASKCQRSIDMSIEFFLRRDELHWHNDIL